MACGSGRKGRSGRSVNVSFDIFGDRWSLIIVRDLMVCGYSTFGEFLRAAEGIATNVLADRLRRLKAAGVLAAKRQTWDRRRIHYRLTKKGISLAPVLVEILIWSADHERGAASCSLRLVGRSRDAVLAEIERRWKEKRRISRQFEMIVRPSVGAGVNTFP